MALCNLISYLEVNVWNGIISTIGHLKVNSLNIIHYLYLFIKEEWTGEILEQVKVQGKEAEKRREATVVL